MMASFGARLTRREDSHGALRVVARPKIFGVCLIEKTKKCLEKTTANASFVSVTVRRKMLSTQSDNNACRKTHKHMSYSAS